MLINFFIIIHICLTDKKVVTIERVPAYKLLLLAVSVNKKNTARKGRYYVVGLQGLEPWTR